MEKTTKPAPAAGGKVVSDDELKQRLDRMQYYVTQQCGTEAPFTGKYWDHHESGMYTCVVCHQELFPSDTKFDSGTGWPSFSDAVNRKNVRFLEDKGHGMTRIEARCANCDAHLGHVFDDGPTSTGLRYCINSASLAFQKKHG